jgi:ADP-ribosylation factor GTPase-activating protein 2/3
LTVLYPSKVFFSCLPSQAQQDISSLKNIAGETGKKLSSFASTFMNDLQDRIL